MTIKQRIDTDLKQALLSQDKPLVSVLRGLKSAILYAEVAEGKREVGLGDEAIIQLLAKEAKKRQESADLYKRGGSTERADQELSEKRIIEQYLPKQLTDDELGVIVKEVISEQTDNIVMGKIIGEVKQRTEGKADGARIAQSVKQELGT